MRNATQTMWSSVIFRLFQFHVIIPTSNIFRLVFSEDINSIQMLKRSPWCTELLQKTPNLYCKGQNIARDLWATFTQAKGLLMFHQFRGWTEGQVCLQESWKENETVNLLRKGNRAVMPCTTAGLLRRKGIQIWNPFFTFHSNFPMIWSQEARDRTFYKFCN